MFQVENMRGYWLRQYSDSIEGKTAAICQTIRDLGGGNTLCLKVADGLTFQGKIDPRTPVTSFSDISALVGACAANELFFLPVVDARGLPGEAAFHAQIAEVCGGLIVDLEAGSGFWMPPNQNREYAKHWDQSALSNIPLYCQSLRQAASGAYLVCEPDPRETSPTYMYLPGIAQFFDAFAPQHYVGLPGWTNIGAEVQRFQTLQSFGKQMLVTLYGEGDMTLMRQFWEAVLPLGALGWIMFAFGSMDGTELALASSLPQVASDVPAPTPSPDDAEPFAHHVEDALAARLSAAAGLLRQAADALDPALPIPGM